MTWLLEKKRQDERSRCPWEGKETMHSFFFHLSIQPIVYSSNKLVFFRKRTPKSLNAFGCTINGTLHASFQRFVLNKLWQESSCEGISSSIGIHDLFISQLRDRKLHDFRISSPGHINRLWSHCNDCCPWTLWRLGFICNQFGNFLHVCRLFHDEIWIEWDKKHTFSQFHEALHTECFERQEQWREKSEKIKRKPLMILFSPSWSLFSVRNIIILVSPKNTVLDSTAIMIITRCAIIMRSFLSFLSNLFVLTLIIIWCISQMCLLCLQRLLFYSFPVFFSVSFSSLLLLTTKRMFASPSRSPSQLMLLKFCAIFFSVFLWLTF